MNIVASGKEQKYYEKFFIDILYKKFLNEALILYPVKHKEIIDAFIFITH